MSENAMYVCNWTAALFALCFLVFQLGSCERASKAAYEQVRMHELSTRAKFVEACKQACAERGVHKVDSGRCECK